MKTKLKLDAEDTLKSLFIMEYCAEHGDFFEDQGLDVYSEALVAWEARQEMLEGDLDHLIYGWRTFTGEGLIHLFTSNLQVRERFQKYVDLM